MNHQDVLQKIEIEVVRLFEKHSDLGLVFHNLVHTRGVVARCIEIAAYYELNSEQRFIIETAAWFHDIGYLSGARQDHELRGPGLASELLLPHGAPNGVIKQIQGCILATRLPQQPSGFLEQVVCDADLYHFGTAELFERDELMRSEVEIHLGKQIRDSAWLAATIQLLESHHFQTQYAQLLLQPGKEQNLLLLKSRLEQIKHRPDQKNEWFSS